MRKIERQRSKRLRELPPKSIPPDPVFERRIDQTHVKTYMVTGPLNHNVFSLILDIICPVIEMQTKVIYSFSCTIYWGQNQVIQYNKALSLNATFTSSIQIEKYIEQCELRHVNLDDEEVCHKAYLPVVRKPGSPGVYEGRVEFQHIQVWLISSKEPLLGCGPLPDWLHKKQCFYTVNNENDV